jgi:hypothetical protein
MDLTEIEWGCMEWINLAQDKDQWRAPVNTQNVGKFLSSCTTGDFSGGAQFHEVR